MDIETAKNMLIAVACCTITDLSCNECPLLDDNGKCRPWTNEEVVQAVSLLKKDGAGNG